MHPDNNSRNSVQIQASTCLLELLPKFWVDISIELPQLAIATANARDVNHFMWQLASLHTRRCLLQQPTLR